MISIVTPWRNHIELLTNYIPAVMGAQVVIVDNGSDVEVQEALHRWIPNIGGVYIHNEDNTGFARANNQGLEAATGHVVMFLNNDVKASAGWLELVERDVQKYGVLYGPEQGARDVDGWPVPYLAGWCIAATRQTWLDLGGWPEDLPGWYYEDNLLSFRAAQHGFLLHPVTWPVMHFGNYTSRNMPGVYASGRENYERFKDIVRNGASDWHYARTQPDPVEPEQIT